jgi:hypothetical protein
MTRILNAALAAAVLALAAPALAGDGKDCADCPNCHKAKADKKGADAAKDPKGCGCREGKDCTCKDGCKCHGDEKAGAKKAGART